MKQTNYRISNHHQLLLFGLILLLWLLFELIFCCYLSIFFSWVKWIDFIRIRVFKIYFRVFKILFKGVQHLYNTYIIIIFFFPVFNILHTLICTRSRPCSWVITFIAALVLIDFYILRDRILKCLVFVIGIIVFIQSPALNHIMSYQKKKNHIMSELWIRLCHQKLSLFYKFPFLNF